MDSSLETWNQKMVAANKAILHKSEELTKAQKKKWKDTYLSQFEGIISAEAELQSNWDFEEARDKLSDVQAILMKYDSKSFSFKRALHFRSGPE